MRDTSGNGRVAGELRAARRSLRTALQWNPERPLIAHGELQQENGRTALERGLR